MNLSPATRRTLLALNLIPFIAFTLFQIWAESRTGFIAGYGGRMMMRENLTACALGMMDVAIVLWITYPQVAGEPSRKMKRLILNCAATVGIALFEVGVAAMILMSFQF